jgi:excisionase family DNA binding protein
MADTLLTLNKIAVSIPEACRLTGLGRSTIYEAIAEKSLKSLKVGRRRLILVEALREWLVGKGSGGSPA